MHDSEFWFHHFKINLHEKRINWNNPPTISHQEKSQIIESLQAWQLGETSEGKQLIAAAEKHSQNLDDPHYVDAIKLFIQEEQKHGENLGKYLDLVGEKRIQSNWGDRIFRTIRHLNSSMEVWTITVIIVENAALVYYQAISDAVNCVLLRSICRDILMDEGHHIKFQNERLFSIFQSKGIYARAFAVTWYCILFFATIHAIWFAHSKAFKAGGIDMNRFMRQMYHKFFYTIRYIHHQPLPETLSAQFVKEFNK